MATTIKLTPFAETAARRTGVPVDRALEEVTKERDEWKARANESESIVRRSSSSAKRRLVAQVRELKKRVVSLMSERDDERHQAKVHRDALAKERDDAVLDAEVAIARAERAESDREALAQERDDYKAALAVVTPSECSQAMRAERDAAVAASEDAEARWRAQQEATDAVREDKDEMRQELREADAEVTKLRAGYAPIIGGDPDHHEPDVGVSACSIDELVKLAHYKHGVQVEALTGAIAAREAALEQLGAAHERTNTALLGLTSTIKERAAAHARIEVLEKAMERSLTTSWDWLGDMTAQEGLRAALDGSGAAPPEPSHLEDVCRAVAVMPAWKVKGMITPEQHARIREEYGEGGAADDALCLCGHKVISHLSTGKCNDALCPCSGLTKMPAKPAPPDEPEPPALDEMTAACEGLAGEMLRATPTGSDPGEPKPTSCRTPVSIEIERDVVYQTWTAALHRRCNEVIARHAVASRACDCEALRVEVARLKEVGRFWRLAHSACCEAVPPCSTLLEAEDHPELHSSLDTDPTGSQAWLDDVVGKAVAPLAVEVAHVRAALMHVCHGVKGDPPVDVAGALDADPTSSREWLRARDEALVRATGAEARRAIQEVKKRIPRRKSARGHGDYLTNATLAVNDAVEIVVARVCGGPSTEGAT